VSSLTSFNRKVVLFLATKPLTCAHINSIGLSSQCRTGVLNTSCPCLNVLHADTRSEGLIDGCDLISMAKSKDGEFHQEIHSVDFLKASYHS
jgi:hypothetical protein